MHFLHFHILHILLEEERGRLWGEGGGEEGGGGDASFRTYWGGNAPPNNIIGGAHAPPLPPLFLLHCLEMSLATQEADGDDVSESAKSSPNLCISTDLCTVFYPSALHGHQHQLS